MKKIILGLFVSFALIGCNAKADKNNKEHKEQAMFSCEKAAITPGMSTAKQDLVKQYCDCSTDIMLEEFTYAEMLQMNNPSKDLQDRLMKHVEPCLNDFQTKSAELGE